MTRHWYVVRSKPGREDFLSHQLMLRKIETFHPAIRVKPVNPRARKVRPYFPGYVFVQLEQEEAGSFSIHFIPGAADLVSFGGEAATVPDGMIHAIREKVEQINAAGGELFEAVKTGDAVVIDSGPFAGYQAIFDSRLSGSDRVRVLLTLLKNRQLQVELPAGQIRLPGKSPLAVR